MARCSAVAEMPAQIAALHADISGIIPTIVDLGISTALNHVAIQLFVPGLKPTFRDKMV